MWTREQLSEPDSKVAGGVRVDVPQPPAWMRERVEAPLVGVGLVAPGFVDSIALNQYHDGSEGIQVGEGGLVREVLAFYGSRGGTRGSGFEASSVKHAVYIWPHAEPLR